MMGITEKAIREIKFEKGFSAKFIVAFDRGWTDVVKRFRRSGEGRKQDV